MRRKRTLPGRGIGKKTRSNRMMTGTEINASEGDSHPHQKHTPKYGRGKHVPQLEIRIKWASNPRGGQGVEGTYFDTISQARGGPLREGECGKEKKFSKHPRSKEEREEYGTQQGRPSKRKAALKGGRERMEGWPITRVWSNREDIFEFSLTSKQ